MASSTFSISPIAKVFDVDGAGLHGFVHRFSIYLEGAKNNDRLLEGGSRGRKEATTAALGGRAIFERAASRE